VEKIATWQGYAAADAVGALGLGTMGWEDTVLGARCINGASMVLDVVVGAEASKGRGAWNLSKGLVALEYGD
jgi:hypothetical protein